MSGAYLRVKRNGKWENIEIEHLTNTELYEIIGSRDKEEIMDWLSMICRKLKHIEKTYFEKVENKEEE